MSFYDYMSLFREAKEKKSGGRDEYEKFFQATLKKFGADSPQELDKDKRKEFFDYVNKNWKAQDESIQEEYDDDIIDGLEDPMYEIKLGPMTGKEYDVDAHNKDGQRLKDRAFKRWHDSSTKVYDRPDEENQDGTEDIEQSPRRHADKEIEESVISLANRYLDEARRYTSGDDKNLIMQLRSAQDLDGDKEIQFRRGSAKIDKSDIDKVLKFHDSLQKPEDKRKFRIMAYQSPEQLKKIAKEI